MRYFFFIMITLLLASCRTSRTVVNNEASQIAAKDSIVFISMKMWHDSLQKSNQIEVIQVLTRAGTLKRQLPGNHMGENYLTCITWNEQTGIQDSFLIEHPLYKDVEAIDENNQLSMKRLNLEEAQFFVRFQKKSYHSLVIKENASVMPIRGKVIKEIIF